MLFNLKALASALLLSTAAFGAAIGSAEHLEKRAQPKGIDVSSHQGNVNWNTVTANGVSFAYVKATEGTSRFNDVLIARCTDIPFQATRTLTSRPSTPAPPTPVSSAVAITLLSLISHPVLLRPITLPPTVEAGLAMASPFQVLLTLNVRITYFNLLDSLN
jgi:hypothetical protein